MRAIKIHLLCYANSIQVELEALILGSLPSNNRDYSINVQVYNTELDSYSAFLNRKRQTNASCPCPIRHNRLGTFARHTNFAP